MMNKNEEALINAIELAVDWGMEISEEDLLKYREILNRNRKQQIK